MIQQFGSKFRFIKDGTYTVEFTTDWELFSKRPKVEKKYKVQAVLQVSLGHLQEAEIGLVFNPNTSKVFVDYLGAVAAPEVLFVENRVTEEARSATKKAKVKNGKV